MKNSLNIYHERDKGSFIFLKFPFDIVHINPKRNKLDCFLNILLLNTRLGCIHFLLLWSVLKQMDCYRSMIHLQNFDIQCTPGSDFQFDSCKWMRLEHLNLFSGELNMKNIFHPNCLYTCLNSVEMREKKIVYCISF